jgi:hypothetical protein
MQCISSPLPSNPTIGIEGCNHVTYFNMCCCTGAFCTNIKLFCLLMHSNGECKNKDCNVWNSHTFNFQCKENYHNIWKGTLQDKGINFIYQIIWIIWILNLNGGNSNNKSKLIDHDTIFTCLIQWSSRKAKHDLKEHHLITRKLAPKQKYIWNKQRVKWSYTPTWRLPKKGSTS